MKHVYFFTNRVVKSFRGLALAALVVLGTASSYAASVTYTISSKNTLTTTGTAPSGSSATMVETYTTTKQMTSGNSQTLTLSSQYNGYKITSIVMSMKSNASAGAGNLTYAINSGSATTITATAGFNTAGWYGAWSGSYVNVTKAVDIACGSTNTIIKISCTTNSLYCQSYTLTYEPIASCTAATTSWASSSVTKVTTDANFTNTFTSNNTGAKTFGSSNTSVATVNATTGEVDVLTAGTTTISVTQPETSGICAVNTSYSLTVNAPSYTITASTNNASWGTVSKSGSVITGSPASGYGYASPAYTVTSGTATVSQSGNDFTVTPSSDCAVRINFEALPTYTLTWNVNGSTSTTTVVQGNAIGSLPTNPTSAACDNVKKFVGWTTAPYTHASVAPTYISTATVPSANTTYYAVFATETAGGSGDYELVTSTAGLEAGAIYTIASEGVAGPAYVLGDYAGGNNFPAAAVTIGAGPTIPAASVVSPLTLGGSTGAWTFEDPTTGAGYYLNPEAQTSSNYLKSLTTNDAYRNFSISFSSNAAVITNTGKASRNIVRYNYNSGTPLFSCYSSGVSPIYLYKKTAATTYSNFATTCCTAITPTLTYGSYTVLVGNTLSVSNLNKGGSSGAVTYSSSNDAVLTVNASTGLVTGVSAGTATVTASIAASGAYCAGSATSSTITVTSGCTPAATVWDASTVNKTYGNAAFTNAFLSDNTGAETYASSNTGVATVNPTTGEVTIAGVGSTTISVTQPETGAYCAVSTSYTLNVTCATLATPSNFVAGTVAATTIDFSWTAVPNASSYTLTYTDGGSTLYKTGIAGTSTQLTGLTPSTQYLITVKAVGNGTTYCNSAESSTADVTTTALPTYTLTWNVNGSTSTTSVVQGNAIGTLPTNPTSAACDNVKKFVGWTTAPYTHASVAPTYISTATVPSANTTYYAVFATEAPGGSGDYELVTSTAGLEAGGIYTLASEGMAGAAYVLGDYAGGNNFPAAAVTIGTGPTIPAASVVSPLTLGGTTDAWTFADPTTGADYYLNATNTTGSNVLKSLTTNDAYRNFSISFSSNAAVITNTGKASRNIVRYNYNSGTPLFSCYSSGMAAVYLYKKTAATTYSDFATSCVACNPNTLALTSTTQTINIDGGGTATYDVSTLITSKNGNGAVTYSVTPTTGNTSINSTTGAFSTETAGTYYVSVMQALGSELPTPICAKTVKDTIVVLAQPVVTIVDVTPLTFTANCGEASAAQSVSVTGYNLTANMTATAPTNFLVSSDNTTYGPSATFTQASGTASGDLYIKANPPAGSTNPISGNVTLASTGATTRTLAVSATVSCTPVTVTFLDWDGTSTVWNTYLSGSTQTLPAPPTGACAGWTFSGWTTNNLTAISAGDIVGTTGQNITLTGNTTYYAVYSQGGGTSTIFSDDFADLTAANSTGVSRTNWSTLTKVYVEASPNNCQFKLGSSSAKGIATTALISELTGAGTLTFDLQAFGSDTKDIIITVNQGTITEASTAKSKTTTTATYAVSGTKTTHTIKIDGGGNATSVTFASTQTSSNRFYIDNVSVVIGSGTYTLSPACCDINLVKPTVTTSSADQSVTVSWPSVKDAGVEKATAYELTYKLASSSADPTVVPVAATGADSYSETITGLTNCSNYVFTVKAIGDPEAAITICSSQEATVTTYPGVAYTVNYQYGAGTGTPNVWVSGCSNGTSTTLPAVTPNTLAYVFAGWYDGTTRVGGAGDSYTPTADVTLVAQYSAAPTYTLTFVNEGAPILTKTVYSTAVENDRKATEPNANYTDYGLESNPLTTACSEAVFVGWTTAATVAQGTTTSPTLVTFPYTISADVTLYALWKITEGGGGGGYELVTSAPADWSGTYIISDGTHMVTGRDGSNSYCGYAAHSTSENTAYEFQVAKIGATAYYSLLHTTSGYYIGGQNSTTMVFSTTAPTGTTGNYHWSLSTTALKTNTSSTRVFSYNNGSPRFSMYTPGTGYYAGLLYKKNTGTTTFYSSPVCTPMITVDPADVATCISAADLVVAVGGTATSTGHTVAARNCSGTSIVPVITGADHTAFSIDWTAKSLENGRADTVYTVSYKPLTGTSHSAQLQFKTDDGAVVSSTVNLCGTVCTSALFTTQSSTQSSITFAWSAPLSGASLRVWNDITGSPSCGPMPYDQTTTLGTETSKTISGLSASTTFHYQITNGGCVSEVRNVTTTAAVGLPVLTASPTLWETMAEANRAATYTSTTINLTGANMPGANVSIALRGETAAFTLVPPATITLDGNGAGSIGVTYNPVKPQTNIAYIDLTYTSDCETKTVTITLVGNVPGIDIVEVNPDASGFTLHTDLEGTPNIVLSQEVEHQGSGRQANDLFFSKYFEAAQNTKLVGIYNGTNDTISLRGIRIAAQKAGELSGTKAALWSPSDIISLDTLKSLAPGKEIILFSTTSVAQDMLVVNCVAGSTGWEHEGWYPVNNATAKTVYGDESRNLFINGTYENKNAGIVTSGDKVYGLQRKAGDGTWEFIDVIGAFDGDSVIGRQIKPSATVTGMDAPGWACLNGTNYLTKETAGLSTNRHLLIRKNTVVDGLNALEQNTEDFATLCTEWEGLIVPKNGVGELTEQQITCLHFGQVSTFNYDGYYASFERIDDNLVTFTAASGRPGDWVGSFLNPTETFQDSLRCYNLKISVERYYDSRDVPPTERTKAYVRSLDPIDNAAEIAALDTVEVMSTQYRVPILVKSGDNLKTEDLRFTDLSKDTCKTCDVVILNNGILTKSSNVTDDRDSVRTVYVYNGGRLIVPDNLDFHVHDLQIRAKGDLVGAAYVQGNLLMKNPRIYHDKQIDNTKWYFFTLPYACDISKITEMNGKSLGVYGVTWGVKYYDGLSRVANRGLESNWKMLSYSETLEAGRGYIIQISSDYKKYVRFPMIAEATFTEKNTAKTLDVTQYGELQASSGALGYNNVGWNLVGNPYISYFTSDGTAPDGVNNGTVELGGYYMRNPGGFNENTWTRLQTSNIYVTIPNSNNVGYTQELASNTQLDPFISFFVQAQATGTLTFATTSRDSSPSLVAASAKRTNETNTVALNLTVGSETDRTTILLDNYHTNSYEVGADLLKWKGSWSKLPYFYSFGGDNTPLAFNAINYDEAKSTIPVAFYMPTTGARYTFSIDRSRSNLEELEHVYLLRNGSIVADLLFADYTNTNLSRTQENKQFAISIQRAAEVVTPVNPTEDDLMMPRAITERHEVRVEQLPAEGTVMVMDAVGRTIATRTLTGADNMTFELPVDGVYTITVMTPARNYTLKTVIR